MSSVGRYSLHLEGIQAVLVRSLQITAIKMKYVMVFLLVCVALAAAAPQFIYPGFTYPRATGTLVAGPTVVNGLGATYTYPGYIGTTII